MENPQEIERKFCVWGPLKITDIDLQSIIMIDQGYVISEKDMEMRIRRESGIALERHVMTVKGDGGISRDSWDQHIPRWVYENLLRRIVGSLIQKQRSIIKTRDRIVELDCFLGDLSGLTILECEFPDEASAVEWKLPEWAIYSVEVTDNPVFKNKNMALNPKAVLDTLNAIRAAAICGR